MAEPITNVLGTVAIKHCGAYDATVHYEKLNVVTYNGSSYCAKDNTIGNLPTDTTYWDLMAEKGDKGETGEEGYTPVKGTDYYTDADKAELESTLASDVSDEVTDQLSTLTSATPLVASSTAGMTDTTRIYVNSTDGHWYWYNGTTWVDGGVYQATGVDKNDDVITNLYENIECLGNYSFSSSPTLTDGYIDYNNGTASSYSESGRYKKTDYISILEAAKNIDLTTNFYGVCGWAIYSSSKQFVRGGTTLTISNIDNSNEKYIRFSSYNANATHNVSITQNSSLFQIDRNKELINDVIDYTAYHDNFSSGHYWSLNQSETKVITGTYSSLNQLPAIEVSQNDEFYLRTKGQYSGKPYYIVDNSYNILDYSLADEYNDILKITNNDAKYLLINCVNTYLNEFVLFHYKEMVNDKDILMDLINQTNTYNFLKKGYIDYTDGTFHSYNGYLSSEFIRIKDTYTITTTAVNQNDASGFAFYDENKNFISGIKGYDVVSKLTIPSGAKYLRGSTKTGTGTYTITVTKRSANEKNIDDKMNELSETQGILINCTGDSVTEGMGLNGAHTANYGKSPYPARLYTLLVDNGYDNVRVNNYGHGGERIAEIAGRVGGVPIYVAENITIPASNDEVSLGTNTSPSGRVSGTKLKQLYSDSNGNDYEVYFTQTSHDTNPVYIDGIAYTMSIHDDANWIKKATADDKETVIKANSLVYTNDNRLPNVNIMYAGINDGASLTLERFIDNMKSCGEINGGKYIVLGSTHALFNNWADVQGSTLDQKYEYYRRKCFEAFGNHFIDLYKDFFEHALEYSLESGYFTDKSESELEQMENLLNQHIIPAEFSYNKSSQGNVHLSEEGYHVIAMLIFDKLKRLNYI